MKQFFEVNGSAFGFHDTHRTFATLEEARRCANEMRRDGLKSVEVLEVTEIAGVGRYAKTA